MRLPAALFLIATIAGSASAQSIAEEQKALNEARREATAAMARSRRYEAAAASATGAAEKARAAAATVAARIQQSEAEIAGARARIALIERLRRQQRHALALRQQPVVRLTAALQTMSRRPPALAIVQPGSLSDSVHTRLLLGATLPLIRERTISLRAEVERGNQLRREADAAIVALDRHQAQLARRRMALARIETAQKSWSRQLGESAFLEQERAQGMGEKARDILQLMNELDRQSAISTRLASLPGPLPRPRRPGDASGPPPEQQIAATGHPAYRLPVLGQIVAGTGEVSATGVRSRGLTFAARPGAQVIAPAGGRIRFAEDFRDYGKITIIDHGNGWTSLLTGLGSLTVAAGDTVVQGSPIGRAGNGAARISVELRHDGEPVDIAPLAVRG